MKILYDHQIFVEQQFGGISRYFRELMKMDAEKMEVEQIDPALFLSQKRVPRNGIAARGLRLVKRKIGIPHRPPAPPPLPAAAAHMLGNGDYDVFHPTYFNPYFLQLTSKPFVLTVFDMIHELYAEYFLDDPVSRDKFLLCQKASQIIAISENTKKDLLSIFGLPGHKVHVIPLASTFDAVVPQQPAALDGIENYILFVGTREYYKNFYTPLTALAGLLRADPALNMVCTGYPFLHTEIDFFKGLGIHRQMHHAYLQGDGELSWAYRHAALFIFPSLYEGFGFPLLEAFASSCPVICSTGGSLPEVAGDAALYFEPRNFAQIEHAARSVLYDTVLRADLVRKGHERFRRYSWQACRKQTLGVYEKAMG